MSESQRVEPRWRCIKEGEVSPYKIVLCLFVRENFLVNPIPQMININTGDDSVLRPPLLEKFVSPRTLLLIYKLITTTDMSFSKLKALIEDPVAQVRPEVLRKFMKIISNLEDGSVGFLYELFHSVIDIKSSQIVVLRKKVEKNSPFGKFLRIVLMNVRRMSYPQVHYLYRQLCSYVGEFVKMRKKSVGIISSDQVARMAAILASTPTAAAKENKEKEDPPPPALPVSPVLAVLSEIPQQSGHTHARSCKTALRLSHQPNPYKFRGLEIFQRMTDRGRKGGSLISGFDIFTQYTTEYKRATGKWNVAQERDLQRMNEDKKRRVSIAIEGTKSLRNCWQQNPLLRSASQASLDSIGDHDFSMSSERPAPKRRSGGWATTPVPTRTLPPRSPRRSRLPPVPLQELNPLSERDEGYFPSDDDESMGPPLTPTMPTTPKSQSPRSKSKGKSKNVKRSSSSLNASSSPGTDSLASTSTLTESKAAMDKVPKELPASKKWDQIKWWSRKQIERALRTLANELLNTSKFSYSPRAVSTFVEMAVLNPSAQILLSQIYYIEYLNCLRLKDIRRCTESLRTSFDIRIKPNTSELNKGVPYAPYNFAVFYDFLGYKKDAIRCLEEAFRAGHSAADPTCLHYCHNMWSNLQNKPYTDAIVTVTKEVDNNMAYLHSLNVVANAFDYHYQRQPPEEVLYTLWHYNAECDLEEMESLLLLSLSSFFMAFGWHEMAAFPCQIILNSKLKWPLKAYCKALIILSDTLLYRGETDIPVAIMEYGEQLFGHDASEIGQMFTLRHAIFKAFHAYLGYRPVPDDVLATLHSFNRIEGCFWLAYTKMIENEWEQASNLLSALCKLLQDSETSCENNDLKMRCLLLMAELQCLSGAPAAALGRIYEALDIAYSYCADQIITLCLTHIASIQCQMGLATAASKSIHKELRSAIRSSNPMINARLDVVSVKINLNLHPSFSKHAEFQLMEKLKKAEELYTNWDNSYRLKEIYYLKAELIEKCADPHSYSDEFMDRMEDMKPRLFWSPSTCLL